MTIIIYSNSAYKTTPIKGCWVSSWIVSLILTSYAYEMHKFQSQYVSNEVKQKSFWAVRVSRATATFGCMSVSPAMTDVAPVNTLRSSGPRKRREPKDLWTSTTAAGAVWAYFKNRQWQKVSALRIQVKLHHFSNFTNICLSLYQCFLSATLTVLQFLV